MSEVSAARVDKPAGFVRGLGLLDSTTIVAGSMIGSGIFIVSADISRQVGSPGWLLVVWLVTGGFNVGGGGRDGGLAAVMAKAGGPDVYLREGFLPLWGVLYGWTCVLVLLNGNNCRGGGWLCQILRAVVARNLREQVPDRAHPDLFGLCGVAVDRAACGSADDCVSDVDEHTWLAAGQACSEYFYSCKDWCISRTDRPWSVDRVEPRCGCCQLWQLLDSAGQL